MAWWQVGAAGVLLGAGWVLVGKRTLLLNLLGCFCEGF
jgi:hypothetical protein